MSKFAPTFFQAHDNKKKPQLISQPHFCLRHFHSVVNWTTERKAFCWHLISCTWKLLFEFSFKLKKTPQKMCINKALFLLWIPKTAEAMKRRPNARLVALFIALTTNQKKIKKGCQYLNKSVKYLYTNRNFFRTSVVFIIDKRCILMYCEENQKMPRGFYSRK